MDYLKRLSIVRAGTYIWFIMIVVVRYWNSIWTTWHKMTNKTQTRTNSPLLFALSKMVIYIYLIYVVPVSHFTTLFITVKWKHLEIFEDVHVKWVRESRAPGSKISYAEYLDCINEKRIIVYLPSLYQQIRDAYLILLYWFFI